jgi:Uma2 family endonuclease
MARPDSSTALDIVYPCSDGQPMAESDFQLTPLLYTVAALRLHFQHRSDVYVAGNLFIYYEEGNSRAVVAPDVFVVLGAPSHARFTYRLWQEPKAPDWVMEVTSRKTRRDDQGRKRRLYARLGVQEYWQYDPTGDYLTPALQGFRLHEGQYEPLSPLTSASDVLLLYSEVLDLNLRLADSELRFVVPATGDVLPTYQEADQARQQAEQARQQAEVRAQEEAAARQAMEARIAALEAELEALRDSPPTTGTSDAEPT